MKDDNTQPTKMQIDIIRSITGTFFTLTNYSTRDEHMITTEEAIAWWYNGLGVSWTDKAKQFMEDQILNPECVQI